MLRCHNYYILIHFTSDLSDLSMLLSYPYHSMFGLTLATIKIHESFPGQALGKRIFAHGIKWICAITCHTCHKASLCLVLTLSLCAPSLEFWKKVIQQVFEANPDISNWTRAIVFYRIFQTACIFFNFLLVGLRNACLCHVPNCAIRQHHATCLGVIE